MSSSLSENTVKKLLAICKKEKIPNCRSRKNRRKANLIQHIRKERHKSARKMREKSPKEVFELFEKALPIEGECTAEIGDLYFKPNTSDIVGEVIEMWVGRYLRAHNVYVCSKIQTQEFPDYYLKPGNRKEGLLEVKGFQMYKGVTKAGRKRRNSPRFDLANFDSYVNSLKKDSYKLNADYLIFGYEWKGNGQFTIHKVWLYKITDLVGVNALDSAKYNITGLQVKKGKIYNIRPVNFNGRAKFACAGNKKELLISLYRTLVKLDLPKYREWLEQVNENYYFHTGHRILKKKDLQVILKKYLREDDE